MGRDAEEEEDGLLGILAVYNGNFGLRMRLDGVLRIGFGFGFRVRIFVRFVVGWSKGRWRCCTSAIMVVSYSICVDNLFY